MAARIALLTETDVADSTQHGLQLRPESTV